MVAMVTILFTVYCKLFHMMPYIIILKVRKFHQTTASRFSTARKKTCRGGHIVPPPSLNRVNIYSMGTCSVLGITNQEALSKDLENDPFLNSALQRFTCELYYRFGSFLASLSVGIITSRHYLS